MIHLGGTAVRRMLLMRNTQGGGYFDHSLRPNEFSDLRTVGMHDPGKTHENSAWSWGRGKQGIRQHATKTKQLSPCSTSAPHPFTSLTRAVLPFLLCLFVSSSLANAPIALEQGCGLSLLTHSSGQIAVALCLFMMHILGFVPCSSAFLVQSTHSLYKFLGDGH